MDIRISNINELFGNDAGEEEKEDFLKDVYVESSAYNRAISDDRIVCVRSRKGVGKSALLFRAYIHSIQKDLAALRLSPTDLAVETNTNDFNILVKETKKRIACLCVGKLAESLGTVASGDKEEALKFAEADGFRSPDFFARIARTFQGTMGANLSNNHNESAASRILNRIIEGKSLFVFIDDLDRAWKPTPNESSKISAVIAAIREIVKESKGINFRIALREDVWQHLELTDEQMDKFRQYTEQLSWSTEEMKDILGSRIKRYLIINDPKSFSRSNALHDSLFYINMAFEPIYRWQDQTKQMFEVLNSLSRWRPRDMLQLSKGAAERAQKSGNSIITEKNVRDEYYYNFSKTKTTDLIKEFRHECEDIDKLIVAFGGSRDRWIFSYQEVMDTIKSVNGRTSISIFGKYAHDKDCLSLLFRCGFLSARQEISERYYKHIKYEDAPELVDSGIGIEKFDWEIHQAYRPHLKSLQASEFHIKNKRKRRPRR